MGAIQATRDLGDEKTTTDKAKIFSKNCFDTGFVLAVQISPRGEAGTVWILANIRPLDDVGERCCDLC